MKIGIIGNMNNSYFSLTRYLRDEGYDCELLIFKNEPDHFDPSYDTVSDDYKAYCKRLSWGDPANFLTQDFSIIKEDLKPYDFLIGNGPAPGYVARVGRKLDIFIPYGFDLYALPFYRIVHPFRLSSYFKLAHYQKRGIKESSYILFDRTNKVFETVFKRLHYDGKRIISPAPMLYYKDYLNDMLVATNPLLARLGKTRRENDILLVQHTRQVWRNPSDPWSNKGNDLLIKGYAKFLKQYPDIRIKLVLFEYGADVNDTKKLISSLHINEDVIWVPKMGRSSLMQVLKMSDLVIGELHHSWLTYGVVLEALCLSKPLMQKRIDKEFSGDYAELYPMVHADSVETVFEALEKVAQNRKEMADIGMGGQAWFMKYCVMKPLEEIIQIVELSRSKMLKHA